MVDPKEAQQIYSQNLAFTDRIQSLADKTLQSMNISSQEKFGVLHWRAEKPGLDYESCTRQLIQAKEAIEQSSSLIYQQEDQPRMPFVLMSSLSLDSNLQWWGDRQRDFTGNWTSSDALLSLVDDHGFRKADSSLPDQPDLIVYAAVDLILAKRATIFSTCTKECQQGNYASFNFCTSCNHLGNFARLAVDIRHERKNNRRHDPSSLVCWPQTPSDVQAIPKVERKISSWPQKVRHHFLDE